MMPEMAAAGYVLAGGASRRMGRDKALLPFQGLTLIEWIAAEVQAAAGSVSIAGNPHLYAHLPFRVIPDLRPGCGPLAGLESAFEDTDAEWILASACDMPTVNRALFRKLLDRADNRSDAVIPRTPDGRLHPLCAAYRRTALPHIRGALDQSRYRVLDAMKSLRIDELAIGRLDNANTPEDWAALTA
jgi:molybdopterin-guanine dinucleotide biosynthesis protein A